MGAKSTTSPEWLFHRTVVYLYEEYDDFDDKDFMLMIRVYRQLSQIAREYEQMQRQGIRVFAGSLNDHCGRLQWDAQLPNFWCVPILDEHQYSYVQLQRDCLIQHAITRPRAKSEVLLVYESNADWLIMIDEKNDPFKKSQLYVYDLATADEERIVRSFDLSQSTPDIIVWTFYGDRQINGDYFYYAYFDIERQHHDLYILALETLNLTRISHVELESLIRPLYHQMPTNPEQYNRSLLRMKNDCVKLNCDMYDFGQYQDQYPSI